MNGKAAFPFKCSVESARMVQTFNTCFFRAYISAPTVPIPVIVPHHHLVIVENQLYQVGFFFFGSATDTGPYG
jgi:hypothetical protein